MEKWKNKIHYKVSYLHYLKQDCSNPGRHVIPVTKFCTAANNICGSSIWDVLQPPFWRPLILKWVLFWGVNLRVSDLGPLHENGLSVVYCRQSVTPEIP